jgi:hypothetical protein
VPIKLRPALRAGALAAIVALGLALSACAADPAGSAAAPSSAPHATTPTGAVSGAVPAPGRTIAASPSTVEDLSGYRIAAVVADDSDASQTLLAAAREFAASSGAELVEFPAAASGDDPVGDALASAAGAGADLVVGLGEGVVGVFDFETGKILDQKVLVIGGQLAEPTDNVTAVIWPGATSRESADDESVTLQRGIDALSTGVASVRDGVTGVVLHLG